MLDRVALQVRDGLVLSRLVLRRDGDGVVDEEADVGAPLELPSRNALPAGLP